MEALVLAGVMYAIGYMFYSVLTNQEVWDCWADFLRSW